MRKAPLPMYVAAGAAFHGSLYSGLAMLSARRDRRRGWRDGRPGALNRGGVGVVFLGLGLLAWAAAGHHEAAPDDGGRPTITPTYLAQGGAYAFSRNPLYLGGMTVWFGWALWLGSRRAAIAGALWWAGLATLGVPYEERTLEAAFGDEYRDYRRRVRRWI